MKPFSFLIAILTLISFKIHAAGLPGCLQAEYYLKIVDLYELTHPKDTPALRQELNYVKFQACSGAYGENDTIKYKNGNRATSYAGDPNATWYWPNGNRLTSYALDPNATMYYPNGNRMTSYFLDANATYYYGNGSRITSYAGSKGATIYISSGSSSTSSPGFVDSSGKLDFMRFADYIVILNNGVTPPNPSSCSIPQIKADVQQAKAFIKNGQDARALEVLDRVEGCL